MNLESNSIQYQCEPTFKFKRTEIRILYPFNLFGMNHFFNQDLRLRFENKFFDHFRKYFISKYGNEEFKKLHKGLNNEIRHKIHDIIM